MSWSSLSARINDLPKVICGPIVRRTESDSVSVWIALRKEVSVIRLEIYEGAANVDTILYGTASTKELGKYLHVAVVTADSPTQTGVLLEPNKVYYYDLNFVSENGAKLSTPGILSGTGGSEKVSYGPWQLPSFVLPYTDDFNYLKLVHGSCRKPHGGKSDALQALDLLLDFTYPAPLERPQQLYLTGDQIYADDVADVLLFVLMDACKTLLGWGEGDDGPLDEPLPGNPPPPLLEPGYRTALLKDDDRPAFSSDYARSHLIRLGEFYAMYLMTWSDVLWPDTLPDFNDVYGRGPIYEKFYEQIASVNEFKQSLPKIRKALANIATYMVSDDHEITDDWFINQEWSEDALTFDTLTARVIQNGLSAFAVFQAWGNNPTYFMSNNDGYKLLKFLTDLQTHSGQNATDWATIYNWVLPAVVPMSEGQHKLDGLMRWNFVTDFPRDNPRLRLIALDTRSRRGFRTYRGAPALINEDDIGIQIPFDADTVVPDLTILVSGAPVIGHPIIEQIIKPIVKTVGTTKEWLRTVHWSETAGATTADYEDWYANGCAFEGLLERLVPFGRVLILSGDVHYAFSASLEYWDQRYGVDNVRRAVVAQLCSSALKNEDGRTNAAGSHSRPGKLEIVGWANPGYHVSREDNNLNVSQRFGPAVWFYEASDILRDTPQWSYRITAFSDGRLSGDRGVPDLYPPDIPTDQRLRAALLHNRKWIWNEHRTVVGKDNFGLISFNWTDTEQKIQHELWYMPEKGSPLLPFTKHTVNFTVPSPEAPMPGGQ